MAWIEMISPHEELFVEVSSIKNMPADKVIDRAMSAMGKALREIRTRWTAKVTRAFAEELNRIIDLTVIPVAPGEMPRIPDPEAFSNHDPDQVEEYKGKVDTAFKQLKAYTGRKLAFQTAAPKDLDPNFRQMKVMQGLEGLVVWLTPRDSKEVQMPSGDRLVISDDGTWPGHKLAPVRNHQSDMLKAKQLGNLNYLADQVAFVVHYALPTKKDAVIGDLDQLKTTLEGKTKKELVAFANGHMPHKVVDEMMTKAQIMEELLR